MEQLEWRLGVLPHTVEAATGGRGAHLYFRAGPGTRARGQLCPGVDVKFDGGYVVAPPSIHVSGRTYSWPKGRSPSRGLIARLPTAWIRVLTRGESARPPFAVGTTIESSEREQRARSYVRRIPPAVSGRGGHTATFRVALLVVRGFDLDVETALRVLREEWNPACEPPWSEHDLHRKVREAARSRAPRGFLLVERRGSR